MDLNKTDNYDQELYNYLAELWVDEFNSVELTGIRFLTKKAPQVRFATFNSPRIALPLINNPIGIKYIFAIECSNPKATKVIMGKNIANIFPTTSREANAIHTAKQTNQLHNIPLKKASPKPRLDFALAIFSALIPIALSSYVPETFHRFEPYIINASKMEPMKLAI